MTASTKTRKRFFTTKRKRAFAGYLFISPFIIGLFLIFFDSLWMAFDFSVSQIEISTTGYSLSPIGWENYYRLLFVDPDFLRTLYETLSQLLIDIVVIIIYSLFVASILNCKMRGRGVIRALFFLPVVISTGIVSYLASQDTLAVSMAMMDTVDKVDVGEMTGLFDALDVDAIVNAVRINPEIIYFIQDMVVGVQDIINRSGVQLVIFLSGLQSISPSIYEAASIEGCSGWERFWKITLPLISPLILVNTVWTIVDSFLNPNNPIMQLIYNEENGSNYSVVSAMALINMVVLGVVVFLTLAVLSRFVFNENAVRIRRKRRR